MQVKATLVQQQEMAEALADPSGTLSEEEREKRQEAFLRAASTYDEQRGVAPGAWARKCLVYTHGDLVRQQAREQRNRARLTADKQDRSKPRSTPKKPGRPPDSSVELTVEARWRRKYVLPCLQQDVREALATLSLTERTIAWMCFAERRKYEDIATELGMNLNTVKTHIRRTRQKLARTLSRWQGWPDIWPEV